MIWFLIFCTQDANYHSTCASPVQMPSQRACHFIGKNMVNLANEDRASYRCVGTQS